MRWSSLTWSSIRSCFLPPLITWRLDGCRMDSLTDLEHLEMAANVLMASDGVSDVDRKKAEEIFLQLKNSSIPTVTARQIIENTSNAFLQFEMVQILCSSMLREWSNLTPILVQSVHQFLIEFAVSNCDRLQNFVIAELLKTYAVILKRGSFDKRCGENVDTPYTLVEQMLNGDSLSVHELACEFMEAIANEYGHIWRHTLVGLTWDFHIRAKRQFEAHGLRRMLQISMIVLNSLVHGDNGDKTRLSDRFLRVAETILNWNFSSRMLTKRLAFCYEIAGSAAFRPPVEWASVVQDERFINLFFELMVSPCFSNDLRQRCGHCLIQLASVMGECMHTGGGQSSDPHLRYLHNFVDNLLRHFTSESTTPSSVSIFSQIVFKLLTFHPTQTFIRMPEELISTLFQVLLDQCTKLAVEMVRESMNDDGERGMCHESLALLYDAWCILLRADGRWLPIGTLSTPMWTLFSSFLHAVLSPPLGSRLDAVGSSGDLRVNDGEEEDETDDRVVFADVLTPIGVFARHNTEQFLSTITKVLMDRLNDFNQSLSINSDDRHFLTGWQEDLHWILLIVGYTVTVEDIDGSCHLQSEMTDFCLRKGSHRSKEMTDRALMTSLELSSPLLNDGVDPLIELICVILRWSLLEHELLNSGDHGHVLSPQLIKTGLWCVRRLMASLSAQDSFNGEEGEEEEEKGNIPRIAIEGAISQLMVSFVVEKSFTVLKRLPGEKATCEEAVKLLVTLVEHRAAQLAQSPLLFQHLSQLNLESFPARAQLLRSLVQIAVATESCTLQDDMCNMILRPLMEKLHCLISTRRDPMNDSQLVDLLECFTGVAQASQANSASILFKMLHPVLNESIVLLSSHSDNQSVVDALLQFFSDVTRKLAIYVENRDDSEAIYEMLMALLNAYRQQQLGRYKEALPDEDGKASDLVLLLDILANVLSKDILIICGLEESGDVLSRGSRVAVMGLEMLVPLMNEALLMRPMLSQRFYRLLLYFCEMYPETVGQMSGNLLRDIVSCLRAALDSLFGEEVTGTAVETIAQMATFFAQQQQGDPTTIVAMSHMVALIQEMNTDKHPVVFAGMVDSILQRHEEESTRNQLTIAFARLLPDLQMDATRKEKRIFRDRFEAFLNDTQGLLCL